ncbi:MAG: glutamate synthase subunit beta [Oscillospiraceae bacterium]|nr:glutamate synthase subunit beta [Oscillospiraceae bacterium]
MGKPNGFLEYGRCENRRRPALERVRDWEDLYVPVEGAQRLEQGARCMNCGVPFCQAGVRFEGQQLGCPLHNLIPEWNDMLMDGNYGHALARLLKTNNFPEFTGRVCPAFCEQACNCGLYDAPVTVHDNERSIIEYAFSHGMMKPRFTHNASGKNVAVIGSGPAGLAVADQLNHRGHSVTVIEKHPRAGGILAYGIPNMKLPKTVVQRRIELMTDEGVSFVTGVDASDPAIAQRLSREYDAVVLCCGAEEPRSLGLDVAGVTGVYYAMDYLHAAMDRLLYGAAPAVPDAAGRDVIIIGTGNTASDCVSTAIRQGCRSVLQLVRRGREDYVDAGGSLPQDYAQEEAEAVFGSDPRRFGQSVASLETDEGGALRAVVTKSGERLPCALLIGATGFAGCRADVCAAFGVERDKTVRTERGHFRTSVPHIFTAGDMHRGQSLVVHAIAEGRAAAIEVDRFLMGYTNLI